MPETVVHFQIRLNPASYERLSTWAREDRESLNALVVRLLKEAAEAHAPKEEAART